MIIERHIEAKFLIGDPLADISGSAVREKIVVTLNWTEELERLAPSSR